MSGVHKHPTISFRVSDREREMIEAKILASGMQKKDYFVRSCIDRLEFVYKEVLGAELSNWSCLLNNFYSFQVGRAIKIPAVGGLRVYI